MRMNRPDKKNALTAAMYDAMARGARNANGDSRDPLRRHRRRARRVLGRQRLGDFTKAATAGEGLGNAVLRFLHALARSERPLVAAVQGLAVGVGTTMLLHCDHVVAGDRCALLDAVRRSRPGAGGGIEPAGPSPDGAPPRVRAAGDGPAARRGEEAQACGLVNQVAPGDQVEAEAMKAAQQIAALPPEGVAISRRLMRGAPDEIVQRIDEEAELFKERLQSPEAHAAFEAFLSRKK